MSRRPYPRLPEMLALLAASLLFAAACFGAMGLYRAYRPQGPAPAPAAAAPPAWLLPLDDAYIFVRYAQQAARGRPFEWTDGEPSTGASSFLFPWLLVPGQWLFDDLPGWSRWSRWVGTACLWLLGLAALALLRGADLPEPWPLAGAFLVVWSGPVGFASLAGMDTAFNAAALLAACALWWQACRGQAPGGPWPALALVGFLPLIRPENGVLTALAATAILLGRPPRVRRWVGPLLLAPGALYALLNASLTGSPEPAGMTTKSWLAAPFLDLPTLLAQYFLVIAADLSPVYLGLRPTILPPPVGLLAAATTAAAFLTGLAPGRRLLEAASPGRLQTLRSLRPLGATWLVLVAMAPLSTHLRWQLMRHHHAGLVAAWLLATAGAALTVAEVCRRLGAGRPRRFHRLALLLPLLPLATLPTWAVEYVRAAALLQHRNGATAAWLAENARHRVLLLHDAGWYSLAHDGPAVDLMGLGSPGLAEPYRHGPGALAEALARRSPTPEIAAVHLDLFPLPGLLGRPLHPGSLGDGGNALAEIRTDLLSRTPLGRPGLDFAHLPDEERWRPRWDPPPWPDDPSFAPLLAAANGTPELQGCRPLYGSLRLELPPGLRSVAVRAARLTAAPARLMASDGAGRVRAWDLPADRWAEVKAAVSRGRRLYLERSGPGLPCLESVALRRDLEGSRR